jgi:hypothetical protein
MKDMKLDRRPMSDSEYLSLLDYALDVLAEMEQQIDACCESMRERAPVHA